MANLNNKLPIVNFIDKNAYNSLEPKWVGVSIKKLAKLLGLDTNKLDVVITSGDAEKTMEITRSLSDIVNFITIVDKDFDEIKSDIKIDFTQEIFKENGLEIALVTSGKSVYKTADILINTGEFDNEVCSLLKKNAICFDLNNNIEKRLELVNKRKDIALIDYVRFKYKNDFFSTNDIKVSDYVTKNFAVEKYNALRQSKKTFKSDLSIVSFGSLNKRLDLNKLL